MSVRAEPDPNAAPARERATRFRADIEGLRALAVVLVLADHFFHWPLGGFVGVDVFFVISGFLITGLIVRERDRTGRFSFLEFYTRRLKRIGPAAIAVLLVTVVSSYLLFLPDRAEGVRSDAVYALFLSANWRFAVQGVDYLQAAGPISPVLHYWSLSIEEQFYIVWPLLLVVALGIGSRLRARRAPLLAMIAIVGVASLGWAIVEFTRAPAVAYFDTFGRAWEFCAGALVAIGAARLTALTARMRTVLFISGIAGIILSALLLTTESAFPGPWALAPVLATVAVIAAGTGGSGRGVSMLTNPVSRYLGRISYSLYLWHYPVVIFVAAIVPAAPWLTGAIAVLVSLLLSAASYRFIEEPFRKLRWLSAPRGVERTRASVRRFRLQSVAITVIVMVGFVGLEANLVRAAAAPSANAQPSVPIAYSPADLDPEAETSAEELGRAVSAGLSESRWIERKPRNVPQINLSEGCLTDPRAGTLTSCVSIAWGTRTGTAVVIGDSVAMSWVPGVSLALNQRGLDVIAIGLRFCPVADVSVVDSATGDSGGFAPACDEGRDAVLDRVAELAPEIVVVSSFERGLERLTSGATGAAATAQWEDGMRRSLTTLTEAAPRVVVLASPPAIANAFDCATRLNSPQDCAGDISASWLAKSASERSAVETVGAGAAYVDTRDWFCADGTCPPIVDGMYVRSDSLHLSEAYSERLAGVLGPVLVG